MTAYQVGSIANFISQKSSDTPDDKKKKKAGKKVVPQKDQNVLDALFAGHQQETPQVVANIPVPGASKKVKKRKQRRAEEFAISSERKKKKKEARGSGDDEDSSDDNDILDPHPAEGEDPGEDDVPVSEKVARKMKKNEMKNIKRNEALKGTRREDDDRIIIVKNLPIKVQYISHPSAFLD